MQTYLLCAFGYAFAQAPGGGQVNGGVVSSTSSTSTTSSTSVVGAVASSTSSTSVIGAVVSSSSSSSSSSSTSVVGAVSSSSTSSSTSVAAAAAAAAATSSSTSSSTSSTASASSSSSIDMGPWSDIDYLEGTWTSKSGMVVTGPDFYDPVHELLVDPGLPGMSYSFTKDGYWEQATYQITGDGGNPTCPTAVLIFQHGTYELKSNGSLVCTPFESDGRQLLSDPCGESSEESIYSHYSQEMVFRDFEVLIDNYYGRYRLNLYEFDGTPMAPMYLAYKPPQMLPTETMNPTANSTSGASATAARARVKRALENRRALQKRGVGAELRETKSEFHYFWYGGMTMMIGGGLAFALLS